MNEVIDIIGQGAHTKLSQDILKGKGKIEDITKDTASIMLLVTMKK